jgi:hypothetical protein
MTVKEAIEILSKLPDKEMLLMVDCPHCGRGSQLEAVAECVVLQTRAYQPGGDNPSSGLP